MFGVETIMLGGLVGLVLAAAWIYSFVGLMSLSEAAFPGRHDKVLWLIVFVCFFFLAPVAFFFWNSERIARDRTIRIEQDPGRLNPN